MTTRWKLLLSVVACIMLQSCFGTSTRITKSKWDPSGVIDYNGLHWLVGPDSDITWDEACEWVQSLGGRWRMPAHEELQALYDAGISTENWGPFWNSGTRVWSCEVRTSLARIFIYHGGRNVEWDNRKAYIHRRAFAVWSLTKASSSFPHESEPSPVELQPERYSVIDDVITDVVTGLQWLVGPDRDTSQDEANEWVESLGGGWRKPTVLEMRALYYAGVSTNNWGPFLNSGFWVWSSSWYFSFRGAYEKPPIFGPGSYSYPGVRAFAVRSQSEVVASWDPLAVIDFIGLEWMVGPDIDMLRDEAAEWLESLGEDWRIPTLDEVLDLHDAGIRSFNWGPFQNSGLSVWFSGADMDTLSERYGITTDDQYFRRLLFPFSCQAFSFGGSRPEWYFLREDHSYATRTFAVRSPQ